MPLSAHLFRYFLRRWAVPVLAALPFFVGLLLAHQVQVVAKLIADIPGASYRWLLPLLATTLPGIVSQVLPMAALLGGLMGTQHLSEGSEFVASQGLGAGLSAILRPWALLALLLGSLAAVNVHVLVPQAMELNKQLRQNMESEALEGALKPGERPLMRPQFPGRALWLADNGELHVMESEEDSVQHLVASRFQWWKSTEERQAILLQMRDIKGAQVQKATGAVLLLNMREQTLRFDLPKAPRVLAPTPLSHRPTRELWGVGSREAWIELARRVTLPLATAVMLLLGIAMGISHPRFQRGGGLLRSMGVILGYYIVLTLLENQFEAGRMNSRSLLFLLPFIFGAAASVLLCQRLRPHHDNRFRVSLERTLARLLQHPFLRRSWVRLKVVLRGMKSRKRERPSSGTARSRGRNILRNWTYRAFLRNWGGTVAVFLTLSLMLEFATLAGQLSENHISVAIFLQYWLWNLPTFASLVLPMAFLFAGLLTLSDASVSHEWVAMRAGGISLAQWVRSGLAAWLTILLGTMALHAWIAPRAAPQADRLYAVIKKRSSVGKAQPWLHLGRTGVLWHLDGTDRWGFPLQPPVETAPLLLHWRLGDPRVDQLPWGGLRLEPGAEADTFFPAEVLRNYAKPEHIPTLDLLQWERHAPDPDRATLLWTRLLAWLAGPCLLFAALGFAFPPPRQGRGQALGLGLVVGLVYTGTDMILANASRSGEMPAPWAAALPLVLAVAFGLIRLPKLRT